MAEEEDHLALAATSESESRPATAHKDSKTAPGGFRTDDTDDSSPDKEDISQDSIFENSAAHEQMPTLDPTMLPSLPPPGDNSEVYGSEHAGSEAADLDEREMDKHLNDVESSFMPMFSPIGLEGPKGADDTYLFDTSKRGQPHNPSKELSPKQLPTIQLNGSGGSQTPSSPATPDGAYKTPAPERAHSIQADDSSMEGHNTTSELETMSSSPTAAAAARTVSRAISMAGAGGRRTADDYLEGHMGDSSENEHTGDSSENEYHIDAEATPRKRILKPHDDSSDVDERLTVRHHLSSNNLKADAGSTPGAALLSRRSSPGGRPKFLRSRHTSSHSSVSSFITNPESHDGTDADYALQSGGAVPTATLSRSGSIPLLSRSISLGSMASGIDEIDSSLPVADTPLATLEEEQNRGRHAEDLSPPETPRASTRTMSAPTDTVIARHVRNVHVPESVAEEFRNKAGTASPAKKSAFSGSTIGRHGKNMTLKEQSSTIERLSKENFDLKLKVMFLSDRLDKLSEEGVKEMISENVELKTGLAVMQRDNKALKRKIKELEKRLQDDEERPSTALSNTSAGDPSPKWFDQEGAQEREEELIYLRERVEEYVTEIEKLRNDSIQRESEKRNLAEVVRQMGERRGQNVEVREEMDVWKDLLEQETARREQADEENKKLREEVFRMRTETTSNSGVPGLNHTTNIYNITKKRQSSPSRPRSQLSNEIDERNGASSAASTLVEELRREGEQLRHENAELRREVGAQTSMLTSRNREKERLYQEIEDLKLGARRNGGSIAGDSILERSASRAHNHERSQSRTSVGTRMTMMTEVEREDFENKQSEMRDKLNALKISNQDLQRELNSCMEDFETSVEERKAAELLAHELQEALEVAENDLVTMQNERDEALQGQEEAEIMFESLRKEAQEELDGFAVEAEETNAEIERLQTELTDTTENFNALQNEMREMSEALVRLEDDHETKTKKIADLERELEEVNKELETMENNLVDANGKVERLGVQQESNQSEIAFLREEQDGDKIRVSDLETALRNTEQALHDERDRVTELEQRLSNERHQREVVASKEKQEVQQFINELNREASTSKDEARRLRKSLTSREVEAAEWKQRLMELESNLREALGDLNGTRSSLLNSIAKLQRELENTIRDLDNTKAALTEKERIIKQRDQLLESHALESRKLADILDKERQAHRNTKHSFETFQKTQQHTTRTITQQESRVLELEAGRQTDRRKISNLEALVKDQVGERNQLLLTLWTRLSVICGSDWAHNNSLINGRALPSPESISTMLPGFSKNLLAAVKTIETLISDFRVRIRSVEKDLWKEYQTLEANLETRSKRLDRLETIARSAIPGLSGSAGAELTKLRDANRVLKQEVSTLRAANLVRSGIYDGSPAPAVPTGPREKDGGANVNRHTQIREKSKSRTSTMTRRQSSTHGVERDQTFTSSIPLPTNAPGSPASHTDGEYRPDLRWQIRLQELEYKLKAEREARLTDRSSARQRLEEKSRENEELAKEVERGRVRGDRQAR